MHWLRGDFPYWFQHLTLGVAAFESQIDDGKGDEKSESQTGLVTVPVSAFTNMVLFWVVNSPSSLRGAEIVLFLCSSTFWLLMNIIVIALTGLINGMDMCISLSMIHFLKSGQIPS